MSDRRLYIYLYEKRSLIYIMDSELDPIMRGIVFSEDIWLLPEFFIKSIFKHKKGVKNVNK